MVKETIFEKWLKENEAMLNDPEVPLNARVMAAFKTARTICGKEFYIDHFVSWRDRRAKTFLVAKNPNALNPNYHITDYARAAFYHGLVGVYGERYVSYIHLEEQKNNGKLDWWERKIA